MRIGKILVTGHEIFQTSWKSSEDPAPGEFSVHLDLRGYPQLLLWKKDKILYRAGSWNGLRLSGTPAMKPDPVFTYDFVFNDKEVYFEYNVINSSYFARYTLYPSGMLQRFSWSDRTNDWVVIATAKTDQCENYAFCGENAICGISNSPVCSCLGGFIPMTLKNWSSSDWSDGCARNTSLNCSSNDSFLKLTGIKIPDTSSTWYDKYIDLKECRSLCLKNCSCSTYSNLDIRGSGSGCLIWFNDLIDIRVLDARGQDINVKMAASELAKITKSSSNKKGGIISGAVAVVISMLMVFCILRRCIKKQSIRKKNCKKADNIEEIELPMFDMATMEEATSNFSSDNKLGEGGFGSVYKGTMREGQDIAVKRLSKGSSQGLSQFKNEVILIAKLQHRNLVKVLGCCIHEDEKMIIYEYMSVTT